MTVGRRPAMMLRQVRHPIRCRMTRLVLALSLFGLPAVLADDPPAWKEYADKDGGFTVLLPGAPVKKRFDVENDFGKGVLHTNLARVGQTRYAANYTDFPPEVLKVPAKDLFDSSRNGVIGQLNGRLDGETDIKLGDHPGREIRVVDEKNKFMFRVRVYQVGQRQYQVVVQGTPEAATSKESDKFLDSFKLAKK